MTINAKDLPGPKGKPIVANLFSLDLPNLHKQIENWADEYGDVYRLNLGLFDQIVITRPSMIQRIMNERPHTFKRSDKLNGVINESGVQGVFNSEGDEWRKHRPIMTKGLDVRHQKDFYPAIEPTLGRLYNKWCKHADAGEEFDISKDFFRFTVDVTATLAFGYPMNTIEQDGGVIQDHMEKIFPMIFKRINMPFAWYKIWKSKAHKEFDNAVIEMNHLVDEFIASARKRLENNPELRKNPPSVIEAIVVAADEDPNFSDEEVRGNLLTLLMAGEDTTAHTLSWMIYQLSEKPEVVNKIRQEADTVLGREKWPSLYDYNGKMKYIEAAALESMRFKPVAPILLYQAIVDIEIEGYKIEKGQRILTQNRPGALSDTYFSEARSYIPERWMKESKCPVHDTEAFSPFGGGPRFCPGRNLAILEIRMVISMLMKNFDFEMATNNKDVNEVMAFVMMSSGYKVKLKRRE